MAASLWWWSASTAGRASGETRSGATRTSDVLRGHTRASSVVSTRRRLKTWLTITTRRAYAFHSRAPTAARSPALSERSWPTTCRRGALLQSFLVPSATQAARRSFLARPWRTTSRAVTCHSSRLVTGKRRR